MLSDLGDEGGQGVPRSGDEVQVGDRSGSGVVKHVHVGLLVVVAAEPNEVVADAVRS